MNVPLDRLYNFLHDISDHDISIYRFYPHGSKNLEDLILNNKEDTDFFNLMTSINLICHDQEPLNYDLYKNATIPAPAKWAARNWDEAVQHRQSLYSGLKSAVRYSGINLNDHSFLLHSEKNSHELELYEQEHFIGVYYWSHAVIARDWFRYAAIDPNIKPKSCWPKIDFLIYNRAWTGTREYRIKFAELLIDNNLLPTCMTSFNDSDGGHYYEHNFINPSFKPNRTDLESHFTKNLTHSSYSADYVLSDYQQTAVEVVLETLFDDCRHHLTEKILRPIACGQPFLLASSAGSLQYLRDYGFKTFAPYIDETYDTVQNPFDRLQCIIAEMKRISNLSKEEKNLLNIQLQEIAQENRKRFFSTEFFQEVITEYKNNLSRAIEILRPLRKGKNWKFIRNFLYRTYGRRTVMDLISQDDPPNYTKEMTLALRNWIRNPPKI